MEKHKFIAAVDRKIMKMGKSRMVTIPIQLIQAKVLDENKTYRFEIREVD